MANYLTSQDVENYGTELIDVAQRSALQALSPQLQQIERQNAELRQRVAQESRRNMDAAVERAIPNYRDLDRDPNWRTWLLGIDALSGRRRQDLLNEATASGDASRAIAFFNTFFRNSPQQGVEQSMQHPAARRQTSHQGPRIYTRAEITKLYERNRKGGFSEPEWARQEADIIRAGREGRIENPEPLSGSR